MEPTTTPKVPRVTRVYQSLPEAGSELARTHRTALMMLATAGSLHTNLLDVPAFRDDEANFELLRGKRRAVIHLVSPEIGAQIANDLRVRNDAAKRETQGDLVDLRVVDFLLVGPDGTELDRYGEGW